MAKLSKTKEYAIKYMCEVLGADVSTISRELKIKVDEIESIIKPKNIKPPPSSKDLMINTTSVKKTNNVSIMTPGASQLNDEMMKNINSSQSRNYNSAIFRPRG